MNKGALSEIFKKKYSVYLTMIVFLLISWFICTINIIRYIEKLYENKGEAVYYHGKYIYIELENSDSAIRVAIVMCVLFIFLMSLLWAFTFIYSKYTAKQLEKSLSYLKMMTEKIRKEEYDFADYEEHISEFAEVKESFFIMSDKINEEIKRTRKSEEIRKKLILDVSHDLKNPLMSIDGYIELMIAEPKHENQEKYLKIISENSKRANGLVMNLFELSKLESAEYLMEFEKMDFAELIKSVLIDNLNELELSGLATDFIIPDEEIIIKGNMKELTRAFHNILDNVMKYHAKGSVFRVVCEKKKDFVGILLSNVSAVKLENVKKLTDPFSRLQGSAELNPLGAGLGLSIVQKIIEAHDGKICCYSQEEGEFKIIIELPFIS